MELSELNIIEWIYTQQEYIGFQSIKNLYIRNCSNFVQLSVGAFGKFVSLTELTIRDCSMLVAVDNQSNLLPLTLENLSIENCGEHDVIFLESASFLNSFSELAVKNCANITRIPCSKKSFGSLSKLVITRCDMLVDHLAGGQANVVNLEGSNLVSLKINELNIGPLSLLLIEPLRSLRFVSKLDSRKCLAMDTLPEQRLLQNSSTLSNLRIWNAGSLKSLLATMAELTSLKELHI
jgi:hypothetical protein